MGVPEPVEGAARFQSPPRVRVEKVHTACRPVVYNCRQRRAQSPVTAKSSSQQRLICSPWLPPPFIARAALGRLA